MTKRFCDGCGCELTAAAGKPRDGELRLTVGSGSVFVRVSAAGNAVADVCWKCVSKAIRLKLTEKSDAAGAERPAPPAPPVSESGS